MSTLQESTTAQQTMGWNELAFTHDEGTTLTGLCPNRPCPILQGHPLTSPELRYKGAEGTFNFGDLIRLRCNAIPAPRI
jgi:hypothetical protein